MTKTKTPKIKTSLTGTRQENAMKLVELARELSPNTIEACKSIARAYTIIRAAK